MEFFCIIGNKISSLRKYWVLSSASTFLWRWIQHKKISQLARYLHYTIDFKKHFRMQILVHARLSNYLNN